VQRFKKTTEKASTEIILLRCRQTEEEASEMEEVALGRVEVVGTSQR